MPEEKAQLKLKIVTPKALRCYKKLGFLDIKKDPDELGLQMMDVYMEPKKLAELLEVTFVKDFRDEDIDNIDLAMVAEGVQSFLEQLSSRLRI
ncbi:MAG: hypothetical protein WC473_06050 [Patescibacteria group bacterium]|jgi:hypothetical protein